MKSAKNMFISIGFGNAVSAARVVAVINPDSRAVKKMRDEAKEGKLLIDATEGKKNRSIIVMDSGHIVLSAIQAETIMQRLNEAVKE